LFDIIEELSGLIIAQGLSHVDVPRSPDGILKNDGAFSNIRVIRVSLRENEVEVKVQVFFKRLAALR
jgi:hypothetical protein